MAALLGCGTLDIVARGIFIVQSNCLADQACCQVTAAKLLGDDAKKMQAVKMVRINREQFLVAVFGFGILAGLMYAADLVLIGRQFDRTHCLVALSQ